MASKTITQYVDDLDGGKASGTVRFALDGAHYEIDLSDRNANKLRKVFAVYVAAGRRAPRSGARGRSGSARPGRAQAEHTQRIREWAKAHGHDVSDRGRISAAVRAAFEKAH